MRFVLRGMAFDRGRTALAVLAVAAAIALVVLLEGFKAGLYQQVRAYPEHLPVQLVAVRATIENTVGLRPSLPGEAVTQLEGVDGVRDVYPLVGAPVIFSQGDRKTPVYVAGYETVGGPWRLAAGRNAAAAGEAVFDQALARKYGLSVGDTVEIVGRRFRLVGLSAETTSMLNPYIFIRLEDARGLFGAEGTYSMLFVELAPGVGTAAARGAIEASVPFVDVFTPGELARNDAQTVGKLMGSVMSVLVGVAYLAGVLVIGFALSAVVFERAREYGTVKAIGATNGLLYRWVLIQAAVFVTAGLVVGLLAGQAAASLVSRLAPQYLVAVWDGQVLIRVMAAAVVMGGIASVLPVRQVGSMDPALAFRR